MAQPSERHVHLAIDGKALRGTGKQRYGAEEAQQQVLHVYEVQTGIVLQQCPIAPEHNEVSTLKPMLKRAGGDVVLFIKDNTPVTRADLELFFEDAQADRRTWQSFAKSEKGHGRLERRHITTSPDLNDYLYRDWGEVGQVFRVPRERKIKEKQSIEVVYGWTSLSQKRCCPQRLLALTRAHWAVEIV